MKVTGEAAGKEVLDAALIASAQAVEHYELTPLWDLDRLGEDPRPQDCAQILNETLGEEAAADKKLTKIAEGGVNRAAA
jgi:ferritin-like metal-binding protein YciE